MYLMTVVCGFTYALVAFLSIAHGAVNQPSATSSHVETECGTQFSLSVLNDHKVSQAVKAQAPDILSTWAQRQKDWLTFLDTIIDFNRLRPFLFQIGSFLTDFAHNEANYDEFAHQVFDELIVEANAKIKIFSEEEVIDENSTANSLQLMIRRIEDDLQLSELAFQQHLVQDLDKLKAVSNFYIQRASFFTKEASSRDLSIAAAAKNMILLEESLAFIGAIVEATQSLREGYKELRSKIKVSLEDPYYDLDYLPKRVMLSLTYQQPQNLLVIQSVVDDSIATLTQDIENYDQTIRRANEAIRVFEVIFATRK